MARDRSSDMMSARNFARSPQGQGITKANFSQEDTIKLVSKVVSMPSVPSSGAGMATTGRRLKAGVRFFHTQPTM